VLRKARRLGPEVAAERALEVLDRSVDEPVSLDRRARVFELGEALFQSIRMQLSKPKYQAIDPERGANLDTIDTPLNDRSVFRNMRRAEGRPTLAAIEALLGRTDPGPGGFYDDLGDPGNSPHLVREPSTDDDPFLLRAPFQGFLLRDDEPLPVRTYAQTFHDAPLRLRYEGLDPTAQYGVRATYSGDSPRALIRLAADGREIHPLVRKSEAPSAGAKPVVIPAELTADGRLELSWTVEPGRGGNGRGCQVAEVWLVRLGGRP
jgi:hypothetical protein